MHAWARAQREKNTARPASSSDASDAQPEVRYVSDVEQRIAMVGGALGTLVFFALLIFGVLGLVKVVAG